MNEVKLDRRGALKVAAGALAGVLLTTGDGGKNVVKAEGGTNSDVISNYRRMLGISGVPSEVIDKTGDGDIERLWVEAHNLAVKSAIEGLFGEIGQEGADARISRLENRFLQIFGGDYNSSEWVRGIFDTGRKVVNDRGGDPERVNPLGLLVSDVNELPYSQGYGLGVGALHIYLASLNTGVGFKKDDSRYAYNVAIPVIMRVRFDDGFQFEQSEAGGIQTLMKHATLEGLNVFELAGNLQSSSPVGYMVIKDGRYPEGYMPISKLSGGVGVGGTIGAGDR